ncbi:MAG: hypothetical protein JOZ49_00400 [Mycolicibacterium sp.]|nr:hypothetical protein [Mycolicibacterium sp.]
MAGQVVHGVLDGIAGDAQGLQAVSDEQAGLMHQLGSTLEGLASTLNSPGAGAAMQNVGAQLHQRGMEMSTKFADHSDKMANNRQILDTHDQDGAHIIAQVGNLIP